MRMGLKGRDRPMLRDIDRIRFLIDECSNVLPEEKPEIVTDDLRFRRLLPLFARGIQGFSGVGKTLVGFAEDIRSEGDDAEDDHDGYGAWRRLIDAAIKVHTPYLLDE